MLHAADLALPWPTATLAGMFAVFLLAGFVKGVVGLGLPTVAMALLALWMAPAEAAALLIVPSLVTNVWQMRPFGTLGPLTRRLAGMQLGACAGTLAGAWWIGAPAGAWASLALGGALLVYAAWGLAGANVRLSPRAEHLAAPWAGGMTGAVTAATGVFVVPAVPYLQALGLQRDALIQAMGLSFTVSTLALAGGLALNGRYAPAAAGLSLLMLLPALAGMALGQALRPRLPLAVFRRCFFGGLGALGLTMVVKVF